MRKLVAVVLAAALVGCNEVLDPGPAVTSTHDGTPAVVAYTGIVDQLEGEQFIMHPTAEHPEVRLVGHEDRLVDLVGHEAYVAGTLQRDGAVRVSECHGTEDNP